jgi:hypothetical protein
MIGVPAFESRKEEPDAHPPGTDEKSVNPSETIAAPASAIVKVAKEARLAITSHGSWPPPSRVMAIRAHWRRSRVALDLSTCARRRSRRTGSSF